PAAHWFPVLDLRGAADRFQRAERQSHLRTLARHQHQPGVGNRHAAVWRADALPGPARNQSLSGRRTSDVRLRTSDLRERKGLTFQPMSGVIMRTIRSSQGLQFALFGTVAALLLLA